MGGSVGVFSCQFDCAHGCICVRVCVCLCNLIYSYGHMNIQRKQERKQQQHKQRSIVTTNNKMTQKPIKDNRRQQKLCPQKNALA